MPARTVRGVSVVVGFLVLLMGLYVLGKRVPTYHAEASVAVATKGGAGTGALRRLTEGDVVRVYAEAFEGSRVVQPVFDELKLEFADREAISVATGVVPDSAVINVGVSGPTRELAEQVATAIASKTPAIRGLSQIYETRVVRSAEGTAEREGTPVMTQRLQVLIIAVIFGLLTAALVRRIPPAEQQPSEATGGPAPG